MGRVEKQIIAGALALVAVFLSVVVFKGVQSPTTESISQSGTTFTDYPDPDPRFGTGYQVRIPGGTTARCNPVNSPPGCRSAALER